MTVATGCHDAGVRLFSSKSGHVIWTSFAHRKEVYCVAINEDGSALASGSRDKTTLITDCATGADPAVGAR